MHLFPQFPTLCILVILQLCSMMAGRSVDRCRFAADGGSRGGGNTGAILSLPESGIKLRCALALDWVSAGGAMRCGSKFEARGCLPDRRTHVSADQSEGRFGAIKE